MGPLDEFEDVEEPRKSTMRALAPEAPTAVIRWATAKMGVTWDTPLTRDERAHALRKLDEFEDEPETFTGTLGEFAAFMSERVGAPVTLGAFEADDERA